LNDGSLQFRAFLTNPLAPATRSLSATYWHYDRPTGRAFRIQCQQSDTDDDATPQAARYMAAARCRATGAAARSTSAARDR
jgi:hypothetical protein